MNILHRLLVKLGIKTETYKIELFKSAYPDYVVMSTRLRAASGESNTACEYCWYRYEISDMVGEGLFFARRRQEAYIAVGKVDLELALDKYRVESTESKYRGYRHIFECCIPHHISLEFVSGGSYRMRYDKDDQELEIVFERGEEHKVYVFG